MDFLPLFPRPAPRRWVYSRGIIGRDYDHRHFNRTVAAGRAIGAEAARRLQCLNNVKQVGLALQQYHTNNNKFPPSSVWRTAAANGNVPAGSLDPYFTTMATTDNPNLSENWVILILPELEASNLYQEFALAGSGFNPVLPIPSDKPSQNIGGAMVTSPNATARATQLSFMLCPSDSYNHTPFSDSNGAGGMGANWARGNYAANASLGTMIVSTATTNWYNRYLQGVMGANLSWRLDDIKDGSTNTILIGEIRSGIIPQDPRGTWAMATAAGSGAFGGTAITPPLPVARAVPRALPIRTTAPMLAATRSVLAPTSRTRWARRRRF